MFTTDIKHTLLLGKSGVRWQVASGPASGPASAPAPAVTDPLDQAKELLKKIRESSFFKSTEIAQLTDLLKNAGKANEAKNKALRDELTAELHKDTRPQVLDYSKQTREQYYGLPTEGDKKDIQKLLDAWDNDFKDVKVKQEAAKAPVQAAAAAEKNALKMESIYNSPLVKDYAHRINLGSAIALLNNQQGADIKAKAEAALKLVKDSGVAYNGHNSEAPKSITGYDFRVGLNPEPTNSNERTNSLLAIEADKLQDFYTTLIKATPEQQKALLNAGIDPDRKVTSGKLTDMIADFDDDGILEAVNGIDTSSWGKWFFSLFGSADAMQTQFFGEIQLKNILEKNLGAITDYLKNAGIEKGDKEDDKTWAKRVRTAITLQADMFGTGKIGAEGAKDMYTGEAGKKNLSERKEVEQILSEVEKSLKDSNANIKSEDLSKVARQVSDWIIRTQLSLGGGRVNLTEIKNIVALDDVRHLLAIDYSAYLRLFNSTRLKANASAGVGMVAGREHLLPLAHIGANAKLTFADRGDLENLMKNIDEGKSNVTATLGANIITKVSGPMINVDLLWKDRIDQAENAGLHMAAVIDDMMKITTDGTPSLDMQKIKDKNMDTSLRDMLSLLSIAISDGAVGLSTPQEKQAHAVLMRNKFLNAFDLYLHNHPNLKGVGLAGITLGAMPGAFAFGPVFQNVTVQRDARVVQNVSTREVETNNIFGELAKLGVTYDATENILSAADTSKVRLPQGMSFTSEDSKTVDFGNKSPQFSLKDGVVTVILAESQAQSAPQSTPTKLEVLASSRKLPASAMELIAGLDIGKLMTKMSVQKFMVAMTADNKTPASISEALMKEKAFADIITAANKEIDSITPPVSAEERQKILEAVTLEIDERLVGDQITRGFNAAKANQNKFEEYRRLLVAHGARLRKGMTRENMTLGDIASASYDKKGLRAQELKIIADKSDIDKTVLEAADKHMLAQIKLLTEMKTEGSGLLLMARNRAAKGQQGAQFYESGSYIAKQELTLTSEKHLEAAKRSLGEEVLKTMALQNIANRPEYEDYKDAILKAKPTLNDGKMSLDLGGNKTLTIDLTETKVSSALYGDIIDGKKGQQSVCVNVSLLIEPKVKATLTEAGKKPVISPTMTVQSSEQVTVFNGRAVNGQMTIVGTVDEGGNNGPQAQSKPNPDDPNNPVTPPPQGD